MDGIFLRESRKSKGAQLAWYHPFLFKEIYMDHVAYIDADLLELSSLNPGMKTMIMCFAERK